MASLPVQFVGPSYQLDNRKADVQRTVNMYPQRVESGSGKAQFILKSVPGLTEEVNNTASGKVTMRGMFAPSNFVDTIYCILGNSLYTLSASTLTLRSGTMGSSGGSVIGAIGRQHIVVCDTQQAFYTPYVSGTPALTQITDPDAPTTISWVAYLGGRFVYGDKDTDQFTWSEIDDPDNIDALNFATAESSPDGIVRGIVYREELWMMGRDSTELWRASSSADSAFERNTGVSISVGCMASRSVCVADNCLLWIGRDSNGKGVVYKAVGYQPQRVSNHAIEEMLSTATSLTAASAYTYQENGHVFYCIDASGLDTTLCYDLSTESWHERAEFFNGDFSRSRITHHVITASGAEYFGGSLTSHPTLSNRAVIYTQDSNVYTLDGDTLCRERTSPHYATPSLDRVFYSRLRLDCSVGSEVASTKYVQLFYSNDGGYVFSNSALSKSLGETGDRRVSVQWNRLGSANDRVFKIRCTDDVAFDIVNVDVQAEVGTS